MGLFYSSAEGFLMVRIQNVCGKAIIIPILVGIIYDCINCSKTRFKGLAPTDELKEVLIYIRFNIAHRYQECD